MDFRPRDTYRLKVRGWKKIFHANGKQKKAGVAILISDKIDFIIFILFFGCARCYLQQAVSLLQHAVYLVAACTLLIAARGLLSSCGTRTSL